MEVPSNPFKNTSAKKVLNVAVNGDDYQTKIDLKRQIRKLYENNPEVEELRKQIDDIDNDYNPTAARKVTTEMNKLKDLLDDKKKLPELEKDPEKELEKAHLRSAWENLGRRKPAKPDVKSVKTVFENRIADLKVEDDKFKDFKKQKVDLNRQLNNALSRAESDSKATYSSWVKTLNAANEEENKDKKTKKVKKALNFVEEADKLRVGDLFVQREEVDAGTNKKGEKKTRSVFTILSKAEANKLPKSADVRELDEQDLEIFRLRARQGEANSKCKILSKSDLILKDLLGMALNELYNGMNAARSNRVANIFAAAQRNGSAATEVGNTIRLIDVARVNLSNSNLEHIFNCEELRNLAAETLDPVDSVVYRRLIDSAYETVVEDGETKTVDTPVLQSVKHYFATKSKGPKAKKDEEKPESDGIKFEQDVPALTAGILYNIINNLGRAISRTLETHGPIITAKPDIFHNIIEPVMIMRGLDYTPIREAIEAKWVTKTPKE